MSPSWQKRYASKLKTAQAALDVMRRGDKVFIASGASEPRLLVEALDGLAAQWGGGEIVRVYSPGFSLYPVSSTKRRFHHTVFAIGPNEAEAFAAGRLEYFPSSPYHITQLCRKGILSFEVALIQVAPPDEQGLCSLGPAVGITKAALERAHYVIAEVNPRLPRTCGDSAIPVERIDRLVETDAPLPEIRYPPVDETARRIACNAARLVEDGATLQLGLGAIPQAVLAALADKKELGLHTETLSDGMLRLMEAGVITNKAKTLHAGKAIVGNCLGTARLYEFVRDNPAIEFYPADYVNDPDIVSRNDRMTAINVTLAVDLTGQACVTLANRSPVVGAGGAVDFARGAVRAKGGRSIVLLPSTTPDGAVSQIAPRLPEGAGQIMTWGDIDYLVTEYGVADLRGRSISERAIGLIHIAHPRFREELLSQAKELGYVPADQLSPTGIYPDDLETIATFKGGLTVRFRPIKPGDERMLQRLFYSLSPQTVYSRFFTPAKSMPHDAAQRFTNIDYEQRLAIVGLIQQEGAGESAIIAMGEYAVDPETRMADVALVVQDSYQRRGIGSWLLLYLGYHAQERKLAGLKADLRADNYRALGLVRKTGYKVETSFREGYLSVSYRF